MSSGEPGQRDEGDESFRQRGPLWGSAAADVWVSGDSERPAWSQQASSSWVPAVESEHLHEPRLIPANGEGRNVVLAVAAAIMLVGLVAAGIGGFGGTGSGQEVDVALSPQPSDRELQSAELPVSVDGPFVASGGADVSAPAEKVIADVGSGQENTGTDAAADDLAPSSSTSSSSSSSGSASSSPSSPADTDGSTPAGSTPLPAADQPVAPSAPSQPAEPGSGLDPSTDGGPSLDDRVDVPAIDQAALRARQAHAELAALSRSQLVAMAGEACSARTLGEAVSVASSRSGISAGPIRSWLRSGTQLLCPNAH